MTIQRAPIIDALRGIALFGILAVNIQGAVWSLGGPTLGQIDEISTLLDRAAVLFTSFFLEYKFYPIFCFCFGYGFAVQARKWRASGQNPASLFARRLTFMLILGVLHGVFLWFGEILTRYAVTGFILRRHISKGPRALIKALKFWVIVTVISTIIICALGAAAISNSSDAADVSTLAMSDVTAAKAIYTTGSYWEVTKQRAKDFSTITTWFAFLIPQVMVLFLLGAITAQMGWLKSPEKHRLFLSKIFMVALVLGLPFNIAFTVKGWSIANVFTVSTTFFDLLVPTFTPIFAFTYITGLALFDSSTMGKTLIAMFAPAGKLALTNYVFQSLAMTFLLYGYGLGWGTHLRQGELFILAVVIYVFQLTVSHWYLRAYRQGPLEWLWRQCTSPEHNRRP